MAQASETSIISDLVLPPLLRSLERGTPAKWIAAANTAYARSVPQPSFEGGLLLVIMVPGNLTDIFLFTLYLALAAHSC
jgi:hypothetical protein